MQSSNKRIAKNTLFLYFRMFFSMGVGLYTSRLVLDALGVVDYGLYSLIGGIVMMFAFLNSAMASSSQRYLSFDIGRNDLERLQKTFNATLNIHFLIALIIFILAETIGLWFVLNKLEIPENRIVAAQWVYQFSVFTLIMNVVQVPYNALLIAREHMSVYAYVSVLENVLKLAVALILLQVKSDRLILYAILIFSIAFLIRLIYKIYCKRKFKESVYRFYYDKIYYKELISYSGWNLFGSIAAVARGQGSNILLNIFFGPIANTAYSLTLVVQSVIGGFIRNFQTAVNPQIIKNYSRGDSKTSLNLMYKSAKFSFFGMFILVLPFLYNIEYVMTLWLKEVPPYTIDFIKLALIFSLIETISNPLMSGLHATGKIKMYQILVGSLVFLNLPIAWLILKITQIPHSFYWSFIFISILSLFVRLYFIQNLMKIRVISFYKEVLFKITIVIIGVVVLIYPFSRQLVEKNDFMPFLIKTSIIVSVLILLIVAIGMNKAERQFLKSAIQNKLYK